MSKSGILKPLLTEADKVQHEMQLPPTLLQQQNLQERDVSKESLVKKQLPRPSINSTDGCQAAFEVMVGELRSNFRTGKTKSLEWRKQQIRQLIKMVQENVDSIQKAVKEDLGGARVRSVFEMDAVEDAHMALENLDRWAADERVPDENAFGKSVIRREPKGVVLIIAPWNFPIALALRPLVAVLAAGNCAVLKPSEVSVHCGKLLAEIVPKYLPRDAVRVATGGVSETTALLACHYDHIMYTGNGTVGRIVMAAAARNLTPVTLELGGKSPVIIDKTAKLGLAAKRIMVAKFGANAGQICIAPDYILVERSIKDKFLSLLCAEVKASIGSTKEELCGESDNIALGRIINGRHVGRIRSLVANSGGSVVLGNPDDIDENTRHIPPIVIANPNEDSELLREEIFGPVLPVVTFDSLDEAIHKANAICEHPLALYVFSESSQSIEKVLRNCTSGGVAVNSAIEHYTNTNLPFGGVGESGMGAYHGKFGFEEFSHKRAIMYRTTLLPMTVLPPPVKGKYPDFLFNVALKMGVFGWKKTVERSVKVAMVLLAMSFLGKLILSRGMMHA